ncbi:MAG TPA: PAS domain S-box protein [Burkholderiales bacterium]|nr:PAS domain S-box protein [Burkholderiales bacterium]
MSDSSALEKPAPASGAESPPSGYAGRPRDAQLEYKAILANASIGIAFTRERKFTLCNPKFAGMFGWKAEELIGQPGEVVYPSRESYEAMGAIAAPMLAAGRQLDVEWEVRRRDGTTFLARMIAKAVSATNTQQGTVWIVEDITDRKRQADEVTRLLREQNAILDTVSIGICFVRDRRIVRCNRRMEEMYGFAPGELNGQPTAITYADDADYASVVEKYAELAAGKTSTHVLPAKRRDGTVFWERATGRAMDPANPERGSVWLLEDITEQKRAEEDLHRVLAEQQAITNNAMIGIAFLRERKVVRCNRRFEELFGYGPGEAIGMSSRQYYFTDEEYESSGRFIAQLEAGEMPTFEQWLRRKDGSGFWCRRTGRALEEGSISKGYVWLYEDVTERKRADGEIQRMVREQELILGNATVGIAFVRDRKIQRCNRFLEEMVGAGPAALLGQSSAALFASESDWKEAVRLAHDATGPGETHDAEWRFKRADGSTFLCRTRGRRIDAGGSEQEWIWSFEDVTAEREAEARVQRALAEQDLILDNATVGIAFARRRVYQRCNPRFEEMFGYAPGELVGKSSALLFATTEDFEAAGKAMYQKLATGQAYVSERLRKRKDGSLFWCKVVIKAVDPARPEEGTIAIYDDVTAEHQARESLEASHEALEASRDALERAVAQRTEELQAANRRLEAEIADRRQAESRAQHLADHDALTGLPNRRLLEDRLTQALALSQRNRKQTAVMFVDLDRFKIINDTLGHAAGDRVLKEVAERLEKQLREVDTICRMGGDEFVVVLPEIKRASDAANVAAKILETVSQPFQVQDRELHITPSLGISVYPDDGRDTETLIRNADAAMYHAKETGRANYQFFTEQMNQSAAKRLALESDLRQAVIKGEMRAYYQRVVDPATNGAVAHEALLRWQHPSRGIIEPADFLHLAEDTGLILPMGAWILAEACRWANSVAADRARPVSVNLSARQFNDPKLLELVARVLKETGLPPRLLELEVAEAVAMQQPDFAATTLKKLKDLGTGLTLDDFGTGLSGVAHLRRFPVDRLKIDRSLVSNVQKDADHHAVVAAIVGLGHALSLKIVAKGVETAVQKEMLLACGCDYLQGSYIGAPVDAETAARDSAQAPL